MSQVIHGTIVGSTIHLASDPGLSDGQEVEVVLRPISRRSTEPGQGLVAAFGGWSDDPAGLARYIHDVYEARRSDGRELPE